MRKRASRLLVVVVTVLAASTAAAESAAGEPLDNLAPPAREDVLAQQAADAAEAPAEPAGPAEPERAARAPAKPLFDEYATTPPPLGIVDIAGPILKTFLMLGVVLLIAYLSLHKGLGKLVAHQTAGKRIKVVERVPLDPKRALYLVELDGKQMLLGAGDAGVVHLKDVDKPAAGKDASKPGFGARFAEALERRADKPPVTASVPRTDETATEGAKS